MITGFVTSALQRFKRGQLRADYVAWLSGRASPEQATRCLHDLIYKYHVMSRVDGDATELAIAEGERRVVVYLLQQGRIRPERVQEITEREILE